MDTKQRQIAVERCVKQILGLPVAPAQGAGKKKPAPKAKKGAKKAVGLKSKDGGAEGEDSTASPTELPPRQSTNVESPSLEAVLKVADIVETCVSVIESVGEQAAAGAETVDRALLKESLQADILNEMMGSASAGELSLGLSVQYDLSSQFAEKFSEKVEGSALSTAIKRRGLKTARKEEEPVEDQQQEQGSPVDGDATDEVKPDSATTEPQLATSRPEPPKNDNDDWRAKRRRFEEEQKNKPAQQLVDDSPEQQKQEGKKGGKQPKGKKSKAEGDKNATIKPGNTSGHDDSWGQGLLAPPTTTGGGSNNNSSGGLLSAPPVAAVLQQGVQLVGAMMGGGGQAPPPYGAGFMQQAMQQGFGGMMMMGGGGGLMAPPMMGGGGFGFGGQQQQQQGFGMGGNPPTSNGWGDNGKQQQQRPQQQQYQPRTRVNPDQRFLTVEHIECRGTVDKLRLWLEKEINYMCRGSDTVLKILNLIVVPMSKLHEIQGRKVEEGSTAADGAPSSGTTGAEGTALGMYGAVASIKHPKIAQEVLSNPFHLRGQEKATCRAASTDEIKCFREEFGGRVAEAEEKLAAALATMDQKLELRSLLAAKEKARSADLAGIEAEIKSLKEKNPEDGAIVVAEAKCEPIKAEIEKLRGQIRSLGADPSFESSTAQLTNDGGVVYLMDAPMKLSDQQVAVLFQTAWPFVKPLHLWRDPSSNNLCVSLASNHQPWQIMKFLDAKNYELKMKVTPYHQKEVTDKDTKKEAVAFNLRITPYNNTNDNHSQQQQRNY